MTAGLAPGALITAAPTEVGGSLRRLARPPDAPPLPPVRSLAYFRPVVDELRTHPTPDGYLDYLRLKLRQACDAKSANAPISTFSDDR